MSASTIAQEHHVLVKNLADKNSVMKALTEKGLLNINDAKNLIMLPNEYSVAQAMDVVRHASSHPELRELRGNYGDSGNYGDRCINP